MTEDLMVLMELPPEKVLRASGEQKFRALIVVATNETWAILNRVGGHLDAIPTPALTDMLTIWRWVGAACTLQLILADLDNPGRIEPITGLVAMIETELATRNETP